MAGTALRASRLASLIALLAAGLCARPAAGAGRIPILYSSDLFHPHQDPDDHYDLATLFAMDEFDIQGIILDLGARQKLQMGRPPVEQMIRIARRRPPYAIGLSRPLRSRDDQALDEPEEFQGGVRLILDTLRQSPEKVVLFTTGSCRDVAAAYNRDPELLRRKVRGVYFNIGRGPGEPQDESNVAYDRTAYVRLFESGLPLYWCPCFGKDCYETYYKVDQPETLRGCTLPVRNYFVYCLDLLKTDPLAFLDPGEHPLPQGPRNMWCTAPFFHAAGRRITQRAPDDFAALPPDEAARLGLAGKEVDAFRFEPLRVDVAALEAPAALPVPAPGQVAAGYLGRSEDKVGTHLPAPDGRPDCCVRVFGVRDGAIRNIVITGPKEGRWEYVETPRWWRLAYERVPGRPALDCYFQFYAPGEHEVEILYETGEPQRARSQVPDVAASDLRFDLKPARPNAFVFRQTDSRYGAILGACLRNLLAGLGRERR